MTKALPVLPPMALGGKGLRCRDDAQIDERRGDCEGVAGTGVVGQGGFVEGFDRGDGGDDDVIAARRERRNGGGDGEGAFSIDGHAADALIVQRADFNVTRGVEIVAGTQGDGDIDMLRRRQCDGAQVADAYRHRPGIGMPQDERRRKRVAGDGRGLDRRCLG